MSMTAAYLAQERLRRIHRMLWASGFCFGAAVILLVAIAIFAIV